MPEDNTKDFLINSFTELQDEIYDTVKILKRLLKETNPHTDPVEPSQKQPPTSHDKKRSTNALPHLPEALGHQLTQKTSSFPQQSTIPNPPQTTTFSSRASTAFTNANNKERQWSNR